MRSDELILAQSLTQQLAKHSNATADGGHALVAPAAAEIS